MEKQSINCQITEQEYTRLKELKSILNVKTMSEVFEPALAYVAEHKEIEVKARVRNTDIKWKRMCFIFSTEVCKLLDRYAHSNFRDLTNTLRFLINASYESISKK